MASVDKNEFITQLRFRSQAARTLPHETLDIFVDMALRAYSEKLPLVKIAKDNETVDSGLYDFPDDAIRILQIVDSASRKPIEFAIEQNGAKQIRLGSIAGRSYEELLEQPFYGSPLSSSVSDTVTSFETFDIEYAALHTLSTISEFGVEALTVYIEYLMFQEKASNPEDFVEVVDTDPSGASTTLRNASAGKGYMDMSKAKLEQFNHFMGIAYGVRS